MYDITMPGALSAGATTPQPGPVIKRKASKLISTMTRIS